ncbi:MAG: transposase [Campylobacteraceae bacterium]|nr:transposase [Campylobacteraceae bacterium]
MNRIIFKDDTVLKIRIERVVKNVATYIILCITTLVNKEIIGIWIGNNETSKYWLSLLNEIKNRGVEDVLIFAIDANYIYPKVEIQR